MASERAWPVGETRSHTFEFSKGERPAAAITEAVTWFTESDATDVEPLGDVVDLDWLHAVFGEHRPAAGRSPAGRSAAGLTTDEPPTDEVSLVFEYGGCTVTVEPGRFTVEREAPARQSQAVGVAND